jgi:hypothetical protein
MQGWSGRATGHTRLAQELSELATKELGLVALSTALGMRVAYMEALGGGSDCGRVVRAER